MSIAARVKHFLDHNRVSYQVLNHERRYTLFEVIEQLGISEREVLKAVPITDGLTTLLAILPWTHEIDFVSLEHEFKSRFHVLPCEKNHQLFYDCDKDCIPPFGEAYELGVILDSSIESLLNVYVEAGSQSALLHMGIEEFRFLNGGAPLFSFAYPCIKNSNAIVIQQAPELKDIASIFPNLPALAQSIFEQAERLTRHHHAPSLKSFSRYFPFAGFDHIALALATNEVLRLPKEVFQGSEVFWKHALYAAKLAEKLAREIPCIKTVPKTVATKIQSLDPELTYLLGFTHNFGFLLFGHLFPHEFRLLNKWMQQNPNTPVNKLEKRLLKMGKSKQMAGRGHTALGAWLMEYWKMPEVFIIVASEHHTADYDGPYATYIKLIQFTNHLLKMAGVGNETCAISLEQHLSYFGLATGDIERIVEDLMANPEDSPLREIALHFAN